MSKSKLSESDTVRLGLMEKVELEGISWWEIADRAPSWTYKYMLQRGITDKTDNPFATEEFADWLRSYYPERALFGGLADTIEFTPDVGALVSEYELDLTGLQFSDARGDYWIRLSSPHCPAALIEYVMTRRPETIDENYSCVRSRVFMSREFAEWVCDHDEELADLLGVGVRQAVRLDDEA